MHLRDTVAGHAVASVTVPWETTPEAVEHHRPLPPAGTPPPSAAPDPATA